MIVNVILNLLLIPKYGIIGSAIATLISYSVVIFSLILFSDVREQIKMIFKSLIFYNLFKMLIKFIGKNSD